MWGSQVTREQLRNTINRIAVIPELPREHSPLDHTDPSNQLPIDRENQLASNLAFLAATSDDNTEIMAVCVEEHTDGEGITIRLAMNTGNMVKVVKGFEGLACILEQAAQRGTIAKTNIQTKLRDHVVGMDLDRILSRLRSQHAPPSSKATGKAALFTQLTEAVSQTVVPRKQISHDDLTLVKKHTRVLNDLFTRLERVNDRVSGEAELKTILENIIPAVHEYITTTKYTVVIQAHKGDPNTKKHLPVALGKLAQYYFVPNELICAARKYRAFRRVLVEPFTIEIPPGLAPKDHKIHAEIQLLFYYEINPGRPKPRIISSSKSACYLCNLFLHTHGVFQTPRTHGRLRSAWILPDWLQLPVPRRKELALIVTRFKTALDSASKSRNMRHPYPYESVLLVPGHWSSATASSASAASTSTIRPPLAVVEEEFTPLERPELPLTPPESPEKACVPDDETRRDRTPDHTQAKAETEDPRVIIDQSASPERPSIHLSAPSSLSSELTFSVILQPNELPYDKLITLTKPTLHLQVEQLTLTIDFIHVSAGRLQIEQLHDESTCQSPGSQAIDINTIPTSKELQLRPPPSSDELMLRLKKGESGIVNLRFTWINSNNEE